MLLLRLQSREEFLRLESTAAGGRGGGVPDWAVVRGRGLGWR